MESMWCIYEGQVYDVTDYVKVHPGGYDVLAKLGGKDITACYS